MAEDQTYKVPEYITMDDALNEDDWGLIINRSGELKGIYIPRGSENNEVPEAIAEICETFFGVDWDEEDTFRTVHQNRRSMEVIVRNNNVEKALRILKKKIKKEGLMTELRERQYYVKPSEKRRLAKKRGIKRVAKERAKREAMMQIK